MNKDLLIKKIRKLLRLASRTTGPESKVAAERAKQLMQRHGLEVEIEDIVRIAMPGVHGVIWREVLLTRCAMANRCGIVTYTKEPQSHALSGDSKDVDAAKALYLHLAFQFTVGSLVTCKTFIAAKVPDTTPRRDEIVAAVEEVWFRAFLLAATENSLRPPAPPAPPKPAATQGEGTDMSSTPEQQAATDRDAKEMQGIAEELNKLAGLVGAANAEFLQKTAFTHGWEVGGSVCGLVMRALVAHEEKSANSERVTFALDWEHSENAESLPR